MDTRVFEQMFFEISPGRTSLLASIAVPLSAMCEKLMLIPLMETVKKMVG
jgi:hypothetical protein